ncbi:MAG: O-antigen ligase family protein [Candidatus Brocadiaceae bacterium]|nr:O-antigen ligase family protein [Candidatus Brocadiaceae bacterium]
MDDRKDRLSGAGLFAVIAAVVAAPWLFGAAEPWAYLLVSLLVGAGTCLWLLSVIRCPAARLRAPLTTVSLLLLVGLVLFQMLPLPGGLTARLNPLGAQAREARVQTFEAMRTAGADDYLLGGADEQPEWAGVSAAPGATLRSLYLLVAYVCVFLVLANGIQSSAQLRRTAVALTVSGFIMAAVGMAHKFSGSRLLLWFHVPRFGGSLFGPFTNRNHYAAFMNLMVGVTLGLLMAASMVRMHGAQTWRERVAWLSTRAANRVVLIGFALLVMTASVWVSLSRGGISSLIVAFGAAGVAGVLLARGGRRPRLMAAVALLVVGGLVWVGWRPVFDRMGTLAELDPAADSRTEATRATLEVFRTAPLAGVGFGAYQHVFPIFQTGGIQFGRWAHAHNDYAQLLAEGGLPAAVLVLLAAVTLLATVRRRWRRSAPHRRAMAAGLLVALITIALHSLVDYGLHKPAITFMLAAVAALAVAAVCVRGRSDSTTRFNGNGRRADEPEEPERSAPMSMPAAAGLRLGSVVVLVGLVVLMMLQIDELRGELAFARLWHLSSMVEKVEDRSTAEAIVRHGIAEAGLVERFAPTSADALWDVSLTSGQWAARDDLDGLLRLRLAELSVRSAAMAVRAAPTDYEGWYFLAGAFHAFGLPEPAALAMERSRRLAPPGMEVGLPGL